MSCHQHVYVGAAVRIDSAPENGRHTIEETEVFFQPSDGNENRLPYLLPNQGEEGKYGVTYCYDRDSAVVELGIFGTSEQITRLYDDFREELFRLSDAGFTMTAVYVSLDYWM